jgi:tetratricopeptide (TPR) repeat protein
MKSILFSFMMLGTLVSNAQSDKYIAAMEKNLHAFDTAAKTTADFLALANNFERIGDAEKTQWLPYYYAGLALSSAGWMDSKLDKDENSTRINTFCDKAEAIDKNSEIYVLRNMSATQQMLVDAQTRYMTYGVKAKSYLEEATKLNPDNPRIYYLQGESLMGTPAAFGGGKDKAKPMFEKALELYKKENPKPMYPNWGKERTEIDLAKCQ